MLVLTTFDLDAYVFGAIRAGASGFLLKDVRPAELVNAIRRVAGGDAVLSPQVTRHLLDELAPLLPDPAQGADGRLQLLTDREREINSCRMRIGQMEALLAEKTRVLELIGPGVVPLAQWLGASGDRGLQAYCGVGRKP